MRFEVQSAADIEAFMMGSNTDNAGVSPTIRRMEDVPSVFDCAHPRMFLVEGILPEAAVTLLTSESGQGKTMLALALGACVAYGQPFAGRSVLRRPVLYLDRENPAHVVAERLRLFEAVDSPHYVIWGIWCPDEPPAANSPIVLEWVRSIDPKPLVIVDSLIAGHPGAENDSTETRQYMHGFRQLAGLGATVLLLHHSGKAETSRDYRGSSDIKAAVDIGYHLANIGDPARLELVKLRAFKTRFPVEGELLLHFGADGFSRQETIGAYGVIGRLTQLLRDNPGITVREFQAIAVAADLPRDRARRFLTEGAIAGNIRVRVGERSARYHTWAEDADDVIQ